MKSQERFCRRCRWSAIDTECRRKKRAPKQGRLNVYKRQYSFYRTSLCRIEIICLVPESPFNNTLPARQVKKGRVRTLPNEVVPFAAATISEFPNVNIAVHQLI